MRKTIAWLVALPFMIVWFFLAGATLLLGLFINGILGREWIEVRPAAAGDEN